MPACGPVLSGVYITTCPQLAKAAMRAADEGAGFDPKPKQADAIPRAKAVALRCDAKQTGFAPEELVQLTVGYVRERLRIMKSS